MANNDPQNIRIPALAFMWMLLCVAPAAQAVTLTANENVGDGVLSGTGGPITKGTVAVFFWADANGDGTANDPAAAGLDLNGKDLTRTTDTAGRAWRAGPIPLTGARICMRDSRSSWVRVFRPRLTLTARP